jgi:hypothetical protein
MINYVSADEGGLIFTIEANEGEIKRRADTVEDGVYWVDQYGIDNNELYFSSSMDFATEEMFETDMGAKIMFEEIVAQSQNYS